MVRHYLYEAANCLLTTVTGASALKSWGLKMVKRRSQTGTHRRGPRKLAVLLCGFGSRRVILKPSRHRRDRPIGGKRKYTVRWLK